MFLASLALICACGVAPAPDATPSPVSTGPSSPPGPTPSASRTEPPPSTGPAAEIDLLVSGGEFDGSYLAVAANGCASSPGDNAFTVVYSNESAADGFVALHLVLRDATQAQEDSSNDFLLELSLTGAGVGPSYTIDPADGEGEGDAFLDITDEEATLDLSVITPEAIIDLTVICELG
jgi:hypothetical protein